MKLVLFLIFLSIILIGCTSDTDFDNSDFTSEISSTSELSVPFVAVGGAGSSENEYVIVYSYDSINWKNVSLLDFNLLSGSGFRSITYGNEFVVVGDSGYFLSSNDGISWHLEHHGNLTDTKISVTYGKNKYYATGQSNSNNVPILVESNDGRNWIETEFSKIQYSETGISAIYCLDQFFLVTSDSFYSSTDTVNWTTITLSDVGTSSNSKLFCVNEKLLLGANNGTLLFTSDGLNFQEITGFNTTIHGISYGKGVYVLIDDGGINISSLFSSNWSQSTSIAMLKDITFRNNLFVAVGGTGKIYSSSDGITWLPRISPTNLSLFSVF